MRRAAAPVKPEERAHRCAVSALVTSTTVVCPFGVGGNAHRGVRFSTTDMEGLQKQARLVFLASLGFLLLAHGGHFYAVDNYTVYLTGRGFLDGRLDMDKGLGTVVGADGRSYGMYSLGLPLLQAGFSIPGALADAWWPNGFALIAGPSVSIYYPETFSVFAVSLVSCVFGAFTIAEIWVVANVLGYDRRNATWLSVLALLSTQLWPASRDSFPQIVVTFCMLAAVGHLMTWRDARFRRVPVVVGCFLGLLVAVRPFDAVLALPPIGIYALWQERDEILRTKNLFTPSMVALALPILVSGVVVGAHNAARFGSPFILVPAGQTTIAFNNPILTGAYGLLLSGHRGIVYYSPPVILGVIGLLMLARRKPAEALLFSTIIVVFVLAYSRYALWDAGVSWGSRFLVPIVPLALLPVGELLHRHRVLFVVAIALAALGLFVQVVGTVVDFHRVAVNLAKSATAGSGGVLNPILLHWQSLRDGQNLDWLLVRVYDARGWVPAAAFAAVPTLLIVFAGRELWRNGGASNRTGASGDTETRGTLT